MLRENQTDKVKVSLYNGVKMFTEQLQGHYYKQFSGDVEDLASDFYVEFLAEKGADKLSMLDRYNGESISGSKERAWYAYIKTCVTRALIDESRTHPWVDYSIDSFLDEYGDCAKFEAEEDVDSDTYDYKVLKGDMVRRVEHMRPKEFQKLKNKYESERSVLAPACREVMDEVFDRRIYVSSNVGMLPVYKVSKDKVSAVYKDKMITFNKMLGKPTKDVGVELTPKGMAYIQQYKQYSADMDRNEFIKSAK